jgi:anti-sigma-K factor RskA
VRECPTHGALLGGYVLGSLEPAEMDEMRRHVPGCPYCGPESRGLDSLPGLLDSIEPADVPPPTLSPSIEEAVLDRYARERRAQRSRPRRRLRLTLPRLAALAATCAVIAVVAVLALGEDENGSRAYASARLTPVVDGSDASARAWAQDVPAGTRVRLRARNLPTRHGAMYELWCVRSDGRWVSGGTFRAASDGRAEAELTAAVRPGDYHSMVVTRHRDGKHGPTLLRGDLHY